MNELSQKILTSYQVRKSRAQKRNFQQLLQDHFDHITIDKCGAFGSENIIIGDIEKAELIFSAHYDTCARLPFPNLLYPKNIVKTFIYQLGVFFALFIPSVVLLSVIFVLLDVPEIFTGFIGAFGALIVVWIMMFGFANSHTANDNTSGVITLVELASVLQEEKIAYVFFDHEELGLLGSSAFRKKYKEKMKKCLLFNFDCVGDGNTLLMMPTENVREKLNQIFEQIGKTEAEKQIEIVSAKKTFYPSDQAGFPNAVGTAAFLTNRFGQYYMNKIHTAKDIVCDENNIEFLKNKICAFAREYLK